VSWYISIVEERYTSTLKQALDQHVTEFLELNAVSAKNGVAPKVSEFLRNCATEQKRTLDSLLNRLDLLSVTELETLQTVFDACAADTAERRGVMVLLLEASLEHIEVLLETLAVVQPEIVITYPFATWREIVQLENERTRITYELVDLQQIIIEALRATPRDTERVRQYVDQATTIKNRATEINEQLRTLRTNAGLL